MAELFNLSPEDIAIDWTPDTFGHAATVPSYLSRGAVTYSYLHRPGVHTQDQPVPQAFWWEGPDGARVLVQNDMKPSYNGAISPEIVPNRLQDFADETGLDFALYVYGVGDHGGGPTRRDLFRLQELNAWPIFPTIRHATATEYFQRLEAEGRKLPVLTGELNFEFTGCYSSQSLIKKANRFGEKRLVDSETAAVCASRIANTDYPAERLLGAWRNILFNHFHDILPGSGVHDTRTYTHGIYQEAMATATTVETNALRAIAARVDTSAAKNEAELPPHLAPTAMGAGIGFGTQDGGCSQYGLCHGNDDRPYFLFNPTPYERSELIEVVLWEGITGWEDRDPSSISYVAVGPDGEEIQTQHVQAPRSSSGNLLQARVMGDGKYWGHRFVRLTFPVTVPGWGYAIYTVKEGTAEVEPTCRQLGRKHQCGYTFYERSPEGLENDKVRCEIDPITGGIKSLVDKTTGVELVKDSGALLQFGVERPHTMSSWCVDHCNSWKDLEVVKIQRNCDGPYLSRIIVDYRIRESNFSLIYSLSVGDPNVQARVQGTCFERGGEDGYPVLRFSVPTTLTEPQARYEIPFGTIDREMEHGEEVPSLRWGMLRDEKNGLMLLNDSKHGYSVDGNRLNLTLIRSSTDPDPLPEIGQHDIQLALRPVSADIANADAIAIGRRFNHELKVVNTDAHDGDLPLASSFIRVSGNAVVDSVKQAEEDEALIIRLYETEGRKAKAVLELAPFLGKAKAAHELDLLERPVGKAKVRGRKVQIELAPRSISTIRIDFK